MFDSWGESKEQRQQGLRKVSGLAELKNREKKRKEEGPCLGFGKGQQSEADAVLALDHYGHEPPNRPGANGTA